MPNAILWRRIDLPGHKIATLGALDSGGKLSGTAIFLPEQGSSKLDFEVMCDASWQTTFVQVNERVVLAHLRSTSA
jgi:hypothetical protein